MIKNALSYIIYCKLCGAGALFSNGLMVPATVTCSPHHKYSLFYSFYHLTVIGLAGQYHLIHKGGGAKSEIPDRHQEGSCFFFGPFIAII